MRLNRQRFNRHVRHMGQDVIWSPAFRCSCITPETRSPDPRCLLCRKRGWVYGDSVKTICAPQSQKTQAQWAQSGMYEEGDIVITVPENSPMWDGGQHDRVLMENTTEKFSVVLQRGAPSESISHISVISIDRVFWRHPQTQALVEGGIPVQSPEGVLSWPDGGEPPAGTAYSLTGRRRVEYYLFQDFPSNRNIHRGVRLPKRVVLRRWDLASRIA